jgi:hypothetical protein
MTTRARNAFYRRRAAFLVVLLILLFAGGLLYTVKHISKPDKNTHITTIPSSKPSFTSANNTGKQHGDQDNVSQPQSDKFSTSAQSSKGLRVPSNEGLVSNHSPKASLPGEQSVCSTTPGASCYIGFTKDGATKKLEAQTTDSQGFAYWTWDINSAGLAEGSWTITATAMLNGQTKSANDPIELVVKP